MKNTSKKKVYICDVCGHYWNPCPSDKTTCCICGVGGKILMGSDLDWRRKLRNKAGVPER